MHQFSKKQRCSCWPVQDRRPTACTFPSLLLRLQRSFYSWSSLRIFYEPLGRGRTFLDPGEGFLKKIMYCVWLQGLSCGVWDLVPWPGIEPTPLHWECRFLAIGPPRKSLQRPGKDSWASRRVNVACYYAFWENV